jgi:hypothetical protein
MFAACASELVQIFGALMQKNLSPHNETRKDLIEFAFTPGHYPRPLAKAEVIPESIRGSK